jgi:glycosyltransferase involved in cell wall biosynthesis
MHAEVVGNLQPAARRRAHIVRPVLDYRSFIDARRGHRDIKHLYVGALSEAKGLDSLREIDDLVVVTPHPPAISLPNATVIVGVPPADMPAFFGRSQTFVFHPRWPEPFGRVVAEAALAGCDLDVSGQIGAMSFGADLTDPALYEGAAEEFWESVEVLLS